MASFLGAFNSTFCSTFCRSTFRVKTSRETTVFLCFRRRRHSIRLSIAFFFGLTLPGSLQKKKKKCVQLTALCLSLQTATQKQELHFCSLPKILLRVFRPKLVILSIKIKNVNLPTGAIMQND